MQCIFLEPDDESKRGCLISHFNDRWQVPCLISLSILVLAGHVSPSGGYCIHEILNL